MPNFGCCWGTCFDQPVPTVSFVRKHRLVSCGCVGSFRGSYCEVRRKAAFGFEIGREQIFLPDDKKIVSRPRIRFVSKLSGNQSGGPSLARLWGFVQGVPAGVMHTGPPA